MILLPNRDCVEEIGLRVSHDLAGRKYRVISTISPAFASRSADYTTWFGNVYGQSHFSRIHLHPFKVVISYVNFIIVTRLRYWTWGCDAKGRGTHEAKSAMIPILDSVQLLQQTLRRCCFPQID